MSLDVYLTLEGQKTEAGSGIFIRDEGGTKEISRAEWDEKFPGREPYVVARSDDEDGEVYHANITHNLSKMAEEAGIYKHLWRPDEIGINQAKELVKPLRYGLAKLMSDPEHFKGFNPSNGWGDYEGLVEFVGLYLEACEQYPEAVISIWR